MKVWDEVKALHRNVFTLGFTSFFNDIASEMILTLLPIYMHTTLKAPHIAIGVIEGQSVGMSCLCKIAAGALADSFTGYQKYLVALGYFVSAQSRPSIRFANHYFIIAVLKFLDKAGKAIRGPGRDVMINKVVNPSQRPLAYGVHHGLETLGGVISLSLAFYIVSLGASTALSSDTYLTLTYLSLPFGVLAVLSVLLSTEPTKENLAKKDVGNLLQSTTLLSIGKGDISMSVPVGRRYFLSIDESQKRESWAKPVAFGQLLFIIFMIQCFTPALVFLPLLAQEQYNMGIAQITLLSLLHHVSYTLTIIPASLIAEFLDCKLQQGKIILIAIAWVLRAALYMMLGTGTSSTALCTVWVLYGITMGLSEALLKVVIIDVLGATPYLATGIGLYNATIGIADLIAGIYAGSMFDHGQSAQLYRNCVSVYVLGVISLLIWRYCIKPSTHTNGVAIEWNEKYHKDTIRVYAVFQAQCIDQNTPNTEELVCWTDSVEVPSKLIMSALGSLPSSNEQELLKSNAMQMQEQINANKNNLNYFLQSPLPSAQPVITVQVQEQDHIICVYGYNENRICKKQKRRTRPGWEWVHRWDNPQNEEEQTPLLPVDTTQTTI